MNVSPAIRRLQGGVPIEIPHGRDCSLQKFKILRGADTDGPNSQVTQVGQRADDAILAPGVFSRAASSSEFGSPQPDIPFCSAGRQGGIWDVGWLLVADSS